MTDKPEYKTVWPFYKIGLLYLPMIFLFLYMLMDSDETFLILAAIFSLLAIFSLNYTEYRLYRDKILILRKNIIIPSTKVELDVPLRRIKEIKFEKGDFDKRVLFAGIIASLLNLGRFRRPDYDHEVSITYSDEFSKDMITKKFWFDYRHKELEGIVKRTVAKSKGTT